MNPDGHSKSRTLFLSGTARMLSSWNPILLALVVAVVAGIVFLPSLRFGYINLDDPLYVHHNPNVMAGLTLESTGTAFQVFNDEYWLPTLFLSFMANTDLFGTNAWGYRLVNILLHAANAALVFLLLRGATGRPGPSLMASLLFAVHPLRVESVVWISQRKDVLSTFFLLLALAAWYRFATGARRRPRLAWYGLTFCLLLLGLMAKPMLVTFPALILVLDLWPLNRWSFAGSGLADWWRTNRRLAWEKLPFLIPAVGFSILTVFLQRAHVKAGPGWKDLMDPLLRAPLSYFLYLGKFLLPVGLAPAFRHPEPVLPIASGLAAVAAHALILWALWRQRQHRPWLLAGWLWYLVALLPVSGIVPVGLQWLTDRFTYLPQFGIVVALAWLASEVSWRWGRRRMEAVSLAAIAVLSTGTLLQLRHWESSRTLFLRSVMLDPESTRARYVYGAALYREGKFQEALATMEDGVRLAPTDHLVLRGLADVLSALGRRPEALDRLAAAALARPDNIVLLGDLALLQGQEGDWEGRAVTLQSVLPLTRTATEKATVRTDMAKTLWNLGRRQEAVEQFLQVARSRPRWPDGRFNLALAYLRLGLPVDAAREFSELSKHRAWNPLAELGLAESFMAQGMPDKGARYYENLVAQGDGPESMFAQGRMEELRGNPEGAKALFERAFQNAHGSEAMRFMLVILGDRANRLLGGPLEPPD